MLNSAADRKFPTEGLNVLMQKILHLKKEIHWTNLNKKIELV